MALTRKPRAGDTVVDSDGIRYSVLRCDPVYDRIVHIRDAVTLRDAMMVWKYGDGLNTDFTIQETAPS